MWRSAPVVVLLALYWAAVPAQAAEMGEEPDICAMTEVLVAMKKLLILLSTEIRDLRQQVKTSCQASDAADANDTSSPTTMPDIFDSFEPVVLEGTTRPEEANSTEATDDDDDDLDLDLDDTFTLEVEKEEKEEDFDYDDAEENPVSEVITGLANWWENFSPFAPKPTTTQASPTTQPDDEDDLDEYEVGEDDGVDTDKDEDDASDRPPPRLRPKTTTSATTTTTTTTPYTLPPAPTWCPSPFELLAEGCYLVIYDSRDWKSWGEAYAFCQKYRGELAAPWRLQQLQSYLSRYYSDAFWVGARFVPARQKWEWLTGRRVNQGEWKPGQPDRNPGKKCVFLDKWSGYRANNFFCGEKYPFVCESVAV